LNSLRAFLFEASSRDQPPILPESESRSQLTAWCPESLFAITVDGKAVGGIGFMLGTDVERVSAEIGYWLGRSFWGRGIVTEALSAVTRHAVETHQLTRIFALP
jgi:RimJ/RimL family protein N-acetyltransferase